MTEGGGTLVIDSQGRWAGPGHCAVLQDKNGDMLVYHAYDLEWRGTPTLRIEHLHWDAEGWPTISRQSHHQRLGAPNLNSQINKRGNHSSVAPLSVMRVSIS